MSGSIYIFLKLCIHFFYDKCEKGYEFLYNIYLTLLYLGFYLFMCIFRKLRLDYAYFTKITYKPFPFPKTTNNLCVFYKLYG